MPRMPDDVNPWEGMSRQTTWQDMQSRGALMRLPDFSLVGLFNNRNSNWQKSPEEFVRSALLSFQPLSNVCALDAEVGEEIAISILESELSSASEAFVYNQRIVRRYPYYNVTLDGNFSRLDPNEYAGEKINVRWPSFGPPNLYQSLGISGNTSVVSRSLTPLMQNFERPLLQRIFNFGQEIDEGIDEDDYLLSRLMSIFAEAVVIDTGDSQETMFVFSSVTSHAFIRDKIFGGNRQMMDSQIGPYTVPARNYWSSNGGVAVPEGYESVFIEAFDTVRNKVSSEIQSLWGSFAQYPPVKELSIQLQPMAYYSDSYGTVRDLSAAITSNALSYLKEIKRQRGQLDLYDVSYVGSTNSDIPLGWWRPIEEADVQGINRPYGNSRSTNLRTIYNTQKRLPTFNWTMEEIDNLIQEITVVDALNRQLPQYNESISNNKAQLEEKIGALNYELDEQRTRDRVNAAARAARAKVRAEIANQIDRLEREIENLQRILANNIELRDNIINQYLGESN